MIILLQAEIKVLMHGIITTDGDSLSYTLHGKNILYKDYKRIVGI